MHQVIYRKATLDDVTVLCDLRIRFLTEANGATYDNEDCLRSAISAYLFGHIADQSFAAWLGIHGESVIATSGICFYNVPPTFKNPTGKVGYIMNMFTLREFRHEGIAERLFTSVIEEGKQCGVGKFVLHATADGRHLYEKFGFTDNKSEMELVPGVALESSVLF